jgi:hypothetical protein
MVLFFLLVFFFLRLLVDFFLNLSFFLGWGLFVGFFFLCILRLVERLFVYLQLKSDKDLLFVIGVLLFFWRKFGLFFLPNFWKEGISWSTYILEGYQRLVSSL